jgi:hypothetical protein
VDRLSLGRRVKREVVRESLVDDFLIKKQTNKNHLFNFVPFPQIATTLSN